MQPLKDWNLDMAAKKRLDSPLRSTPKPNQLQEGWVNWGSILQTLHANQLTMLGMLKTIIKQEGQMAIDLTAITTEVAKNTTVAGSVVALLQQLTAMIQAIPPSSDPVTQAALDALVASLSTNDQAVAAAVVANTPATPAPAQARAR